MYRKSKTKYIIFMKKIGFILAALLAAVCGSVTGVQAKSTEKVVMSAYGYVVSDVRESEVSLYATYPDKGIYAEKTRIVVRDRATHELQLTITPAVSGGYTPSVLLLSFLDNGLMQIYYSADSGGSGGYGYYYIYGAADGEETVLFDFQAYSDRHVYTAEYADGYRVFVTDGKESGYLDLSLRDPAYLDALYSGGVLKTPVSAEVGGVNAAFPYYNRTQGRWQLNVWQKITGLYQADGLGYVSALAEVTAGGTEPYFTTLNGYFQPAR